MQGSLQNADIHDQSYRDALKLLLESAFPGCTVICPFENHPQSVSYSDDRAREVFCHHVNLVRSCHAVIVYLPEASLGCGIEIWEAARHQTMVFSISPMERNWVIRIFSDRIFGDMDTFADFARSGRMKHLILEYADKYNDQPKWSDVIL